jgi:hypothetical protein
LAIWSIVFAFVFAPIGAVLGHVALNQIRRGFQRGRDLALVGLTLSYTFTVLAIAGLAWALTATFTGGPMVADHSDVIAVPDPAHTEPAPALIGQDALAGVLLSLDELRNILQSPGLADTESKPDESGRSGDAKADPPECAGAVAAGLNTVYDDSANIGYVHTGYSDKSTVTMVDQVAASFATPAEAQDFVAHNVEQWRQCAGKVFTVSASNGPSLTWNLGTVVVNGNRATLKNTLTGGKTVPQYRILASKGTVVIDLSVLTRQPQSKPATIADRMLARVPD